jgi:hypothetical protein
MYYISFLYYFFVKHSRSFGSMFAVGPFLKVRWGSYTIIFRTFLQNPARSIPDDIICILNIEQS